MGLLIVFLELYMVDRIHKAWENGNHVLAGSWISLAHQLLQIMCKMRKGLPWTSHPCPEHLRLDLVPIPPLQSHLNAAALGAFGGRQVVQYLQRRVLKHATPAAERFSGVSIDGSYPASETVPRMLPHDNVPLNSHGAVPHPCTSVRWT